MCIYRGCTCPKCTNKARMHQHCRTRRRLKPHTPHGLKPHKRRQCAATTPVYANVRIINE